MTISSAGKILVLLLFALNGVISTCQRTAHAQEPLDLRSQSTLESSLLGDGLPGRAVDRDPNTCALTELEMGPFWSVALGSDLPLNRIVIHCQSQGCTSDLSGLRVYAGGFVTDQVLDLSSPPHRPPQFVLAPRPATVTISSRRLPVNNGARVTQDIGCPAGFTAINGGFLVVGGAGTVGHDPMRIVSSGPIVLAPDGAGAIPTATRTLPDAWRVGVLNTRTTRGSIHGTFYAVCLQQPSGDNIRRYLLEGIAPVDQNPPPTPLPPTLCGGPGTVTGQRIEVQCNQGTGGQFLYIINEGNNRRLSLCEVEVFTPGP